MTNEMDNSAPERGRLTEPLALGREPPYINNIPARRHWKNADDDPANEAADGKFAQ